MRSTRAAIKAQFHRNARLLGAYNPDQDPSHGDVPCIMLKCRGIFDAEKLCGVTYPWLSDDSFRMQSMKMWESLIGKMLPVMEVNGNHFDLFSPENVSVLLSLR